MLTHYDNTAMILQHYFVITPAPAPAGAAPAPAPAPACTASSSSLSKPLPLTMPLEEAAEARCRYGTESCGCHARRTTAESRHGRYSS
ncbi:hypothetical protein RI054_10g54580 [Pseudoscourfieldia marina]